MPEDNTSQEILRMTSRIVSAYVANNELETHDLPELIRSVRDALAGVIGRRPARQEPAVPIHKSLSRDYLICLEDGQKLKLLTRHLRAAYDMSPEEYRKKWGLPANYPMVAPGYSSLRRKMAKSLGLGTKGRKKAKHRSGSTK